MNLKPAGILNPRPTMTLTSSALTALTKSLGFRTHEYLDPWDASAWLEMQEGIWLFPNLDDTWTAKFRSEDQLLLFTLKYGEYF